MRGSVTDFYTLAPISRRPVKVWPADFDPADVERFANKPLAHEVRECLACPVRYSCAPGAYARPACQEQDIGLQATRYDRSGNNEVLLLAALQQGPQSLSALQARLGLSYFQARRIVTHLLAAGLIVVSRNLRRNAKLYALTAPTEATQFQPRTQAGRMLAILREHGELSARAVAERLGITHAYARQVLAQLCRAQLIATRSIGGGPNSQDRVLYRVVEEAAEAQAQPATQEAAR